MCVWISFYLVLLLRQSSGCQDWRSTGDIMWKAVGRNQCAEALAAWILWCSDLSSNSEYPQWCYLQKCKVEATTAAGVLHHMTGFCGDVFQTGYSTSEMYVRTENICALLWGFFFLISHHGFQWGADEQVACSTELKEKLLVAWKPHQNLNWCVLKMRWLH